MAKKAKSAKTVRVGAKKKDAAKGVKKLGAKRASGTLPDATLASGRALVRIYRQGLGDCILVRLPKADGSSFSLLIDCGVAVATQDATSMMTKVIEDIDSTMGGKIDVLAVTHEHWDHVSGFQQAKSAFDGLTFGEVWFAWTEDDSDPLAKKLKKEHASAMAAVSRGASVRAVSGDSSGALALLQIMGMMGAAGEKTSAALNIARAKAGPDGPRYCLPGNLPIEIDGTGARIYVLGPPYDEKAIRHFNPSKSNPEVYELAMDGTGVLAAGVFAALGVTEDVRPFADPATIPMEQARGIPFFQHAYWGMPGDSTDWRRIDGDWLGGADEFALMLQSATNNTSLVLALELSDGDVLLFAGDAQVGNWLSWQDLEWSLKDGRKVKGPELLGRTVFYKVGHHGSHNATLRQQGLEEMKVLKTAVIPVDEVVAKKMRWGAMPLTSLVVALNHQTAGRTLRTDKDAPSGISGLTSTDLYFEIAI